MLRKDAIENIIDYFKENEDVFNDCIEELDSYKGWLNDDRYYSMDELDEFYSGVEPLEILRRAFYGHDDDTYEYNQFGERCNHGEFNPNREYFYYNGYGNLVSTDYKDYSAYLDEDAVEAMEDTRRWIYTINDTAELSDLFDALEEAYETEEEEREAEEEEE